MGMREILVAFTVALSTISALDAAGGAQTDERGFWTRFIDAMDILPSWGGNEFNLVEDGQARTTLVVPGDASSALRANIETFNQELAKSAGTALPVAKDAPAEGNRIEFALEKRPFIERAKYEITFPDDKTMRITGGEVSIRWALNHLLEKAGIRYPYPGADGAYCPRITTLSLPRETVRSDASYRLYRGLFAEDTTWQLDLDCEGGDSYQVLNHSIDSIFPLGKYGKGEWVDKIMAFRDGQRRAPSGKYGWEPCYSSPVAAEEATKNICAYFAKHPEQQFHSLVINDGFNAECRCDTCSELNKGAIVNLFSGRNNYSESYYRWVNKVAEGVSRQYPGKYFGVLAYSGVTNPPSFKLHPNVVASLAFESYACIDPEAAKQWKALIQAWREKASNLGIWDYGYGIAYFTLPRVYFHQQAEMLRYLKENGAAVGFVEGIPSIGEGPKRYMYLKLFYDANLDVDKALREWYAAAVGGSAAPYLEEYYSFWEKFWTERATKTSWFQSTKLDTYTGLMPDGGYMYALENGDIAHCRQLMEAVVEQAEKHGDKGQRVRARQLMLAFEFYEASAYLCGAGIVPLSGGLENKAQAIELAQAIPSICKYATRRAETAQRMLATYPPWWGGIYRNLYPENFRKSFATPKLPEVLSLLGGYLNDPEVREAVSKALEDKSIPQDWRKFITMMMDLATGKVKNILSDGSFEKSADHWTVCGAPSREQAASGKQSMKIVFARDGKFEMTCRVPMTPAHKYYLSAKIYIPADYPPGMVSGNGHILGLNDKNVGTNYYIPAKTQIVPGQWTTVTTMANPGPCAGTGDVYVMIEGMKKGETAYVDDVVFVDVEDVGKKRSE